MREETPLRKTAKAAHKQYGSSDKLEISEYFVRALPEEALFEGSE
jgi:hypothetical protein